MHKKTIQKNIESLYEIIKKGDFNCHSQLWYNEGITDAVGSELEELTSPCWDLHN